MWRRLSPAFTLFPACFALLLGWACSTESPRQPPAHPQQPYPQQPYPSQGYPQQPYPQQPYPSQGYPQQPYPPPAQQYPAPPQPPPPVAPAAPVPNDPIDRVDIAWLRQRAQSVLNELVSALTDRERARVSGIPLVVDSTPGDVNAFAACADGRALMAITDGMLEITAWLAAAAAHDEIFGTAATDAYIQFIAAQLRPDRPLPRPSGLLPDATRSDGRKVARQHVLLEEQLAFVLGHELAHHHLGHLPCTGQAGWLGSADIARVLADRIPVFNQPNESAADLAGTTNLLNAGKRRSGAHWTEGGALLTLRFFRGLEGGGGFNILVDFQRSHPPPAWRVPLVQQSAAFWRRTGGMGIPLLPLGG